MTTPDGLPALAHLRAAPLSETRDLAFERHEAGFVAGLRRCIPLKEMVMGPAGTRALRRSCAPIAEEDLDEHLRAHHAGALAGDVALRVFVYLKEYDRALRIFGFDCRALYELGVEEARALCDNGLPERDFRRYLSEGSLLPDPFALAAHHAELAAPPVYEHPWMAYGALCAFLRTEDPLELELCASPDAARALADALIGDQLWARSPCGVPVPASKERRERAPSSSRLFPLPTLAALRAQSPDPTLAPLSLALEELALSQLHDAPRPMLCLKMGSFGVAEPPEARVVSLVHACGHVGRHAEVAVRRAAKALGDVASIALLYKNQSDLARASAYAHPLALRCTYRDAAARWAVECLAGAEAAQEYARHIKVFACRLG